MMIFYRSSENVTKSAGSNINKQQLDNQFQLIIESYVNKVFFVAWPLGMLLLI